MMLGAGGFLGSRLCQSLRNNEVIKCGRDKKNDIILNKNKKNNLPQFCKVSYDLQNEEIAN